VTDGRVTLREAAIRLGVSEGAIRKRVARGTIRSELGTDGKRYDYLDAGTDGGTDVFSTHESSSRRSDRDELIESKDRIIAILENQLAEERTGSAELRRIVAGLTQRIPEIEATPEPPGPAESREETAEKPAEGGVRFGYPPGGAAPENASEPRSWWRRMFGG